MTRCACGGAVHRHGYFGEERIQRYRCRNCKKSFSETPQRPLGSLRVPLEKAIHVIHLLVEGVGVRACERLSGVHRDTVLAILKVVGKKCAALLDQKLRNLNITNVEVDELWAFVYCKQANIEEMEREKGDQYTYVAYDPQSGLVISHLVTKKSRAQTAAFLQDLKSRIPGRFQLTTDSYTGYVGYKGAVFQTFKHTIDYAYLVKDYGQPIDGARKYSPKKCRLSKSVVEIGEPKKDRICTSHVERMNLNFRLFNRRHTRLTLGYSKKVENLKHQVALFVSYHNFCFVDPSRKTKKRTPAMILGITERVWTIEDLLSFDPIIK